MPDTKLRPRSKDSAVWTPHLWIHWLTGTLSAVTHAPFHASVLRPPSQAGPMREAAGVGDAI